MELANEIVLECVCVCGIEAQIFSSNATLQFLRVSLFVDYAMSKTLCVTFIEPTHNYKKNVEKRFIFLREELR